MKREIYKGLSLAKKTSSALINQTRELEERFSKKADLVIAVSEEDAKEHKLMGAKKCIVVPNGINKITASQESLKYWSKFKKTNSLSIAVTFVGSGHPPNWIGFLEMLGTKSDFLPKGAKILIGGGVSEYFKTTYKYGASGKFQHFWSSVIPLGFLSEDRLAGLIESSDVILLPITSGGGSNLKTAEAILSGKKIVATSYAFRGFDDFKDLPNIYVSDKPINFRKLLQRAINSDYIMPTPIQAELAKKVQWDYCLQPLSIHLKKLSRKSYKTAIATRSRGAARIIRAKARRLAKVK